MKITPLTIGSVSTKNNVFLAPLAGYSDFAFRQICLECGAGLCFTEMVSAKGLCYDNKKTEELVRLAPLEKDSIKAVQLFGAEPEFLYRAATSEILQNFDIIDLNMGCPVPKIFNNGEGSRLMGDLAAAKNAVAALVRSGKNITVKMRTGITDSTKNAKELAVICEGEGVKMLTLHTRTREAYYSGAPDYETLEAVINAVKIPVIANGGIMTKNDAEKYFEHGASGVMLARGAIFNPLLFSEIVGATAPSRLELILKHINMIAEVMPEKYAAAYLRKQLSAYLHGEKRAKAARTEIFSAVTVSELVSAVKNALNS